MKLRVILLSFAAGGLVVASIFWFSPPPPLSPPPKSPATKKSAEVPQPKILPPTLSLNQPELQPPTIPDQLPLRELSLSLNDLQRHQTSKAPTLRISPLVEPHVLGLQAHLTF